MVMTQQKLANHRFYICLNYNAFNAYVCCCYNSPFYHFDDVKLSIRYQQLTTNRKESVVLEMLYYMLGQ
jgi:hypothetical protein